MNKQAILDEIREFGEKEDKKEVPEGYVTFADIRKALGCGREKAHRITERMIEAGELERIDIPWNGGRLACFRKIA